MRSPQEWPGLKPERIRLYSECNPHLCPAQHGDVDSSSSSLAPRSLCVCSSNSLRLGLGLRIGSDFETALAHKDAAPHAVPSPARRTLARSPHSPRHSRRRSAHATGANVRG